MTSIAVIADVHANALALDAVLGSVERATVDRLVCLGDTVGYNAEPETCVRILRKRAALTVLGNHDLGAIEHSPGLGTSTPALDALAWTRQRLAPADRAWLAGLPPLTVDSSGFVAVHGCYLNDRHYTGYVTSTMLPHNLEAVASRDGWPSLALCGHTHTPMCGWLNRDSCEERTLGEEPVEWPRAAAAVLFNPGSVGQPRDGDPRAAWLHLDLERRQARLFRVGYDHEKAARSVAEAGLPLEHATRLLEGR